MFLLDWVQGTYLVSLIHNPQTGRTILQLWLLLDQAALVAESQKPGFQVLISVNMSISHIYPIQMGQVGSRDEKLSPWSMWWSAYQAHMQIRYKIAQITHLQFIVRHKYKCLLKSPKFAQYVQNLALAEKNAQINCTICAFLRLNSKLEGLNTNDIVNANGS